VVFTVLPAEFVVVMTTAGRVSLEVTVEPLEFVVVMRTTALTVGVRVVVGSGGSDALWDDSVGALLEGSTVAEGVAVAVPDPVSEGVAVGVAEGDESSELDGGSVGV